MQVNIVYSTISTYIPCCSKEQNICIFNESLLVILAPERGFAHLYVEADIRALTAFYYS